MRRHQKRDERTFVGEESFEGERDGLGVTEPAEPDTATNGGQRRAPVSKAREWTQHHGWAGHLEPSVDGDDENEDSSEPARRGQLRKVETPIPMRLRGGHGLVPVRRRESPEESEHAKVCRESVQEEDEKLCGGRLKSSHKVEDQLQEGAPKSVLLELTSKRKSRTSKKKIVTNLKGMSTRLRARMLHANRQRASRAWGGGERTLLTAAACRTACDERR